MIGQITLARNSSQDVTRMVIGLNGIRECCSYVSSRLWGGALRDDTVTTLKTAAKETTKTPRMYVN